MKESITPAPLPEASRDMSPAFDPQELGFHLTSSPTERLHDNDGTYYHFDLGNPDDPAADLQVFPERGMIRYHADGISVALRDQKLSALYGDGGVIFDSRTLDQERRLSVNRLGEMSLSVIDNRLTSTDREVLEHLAEPLAPTSANEQEPSTNTKDETEKGERVVVTGRAGRDPRLAETKGGVPVAKFPLAEHAMNESGAEVTIWHNVVAFRDRAQDVMQTVKKGETYKVAGYRHERKGRNGKIEHEIYAASVKPPSKPKSETLQTG